MAIETKKIENKLNLSEYEISSTVGNINNFLIEYQKIDNDVNINQSSKSIKNKEEFVNNNWKYFNDLRSQYNLEPFSRQEFDDFINKSLLAVEEYNAEFPKDPNESDLRMKMEKKYQESLLEAALSDNKAKMEDAENIWKDTDQIGQAELGKLENQEDIKKSLIGNIRDYVTISNELEKNQADVSNQEFASQAEKKILNERNKLGLPVIEESEIDEYFANLQSNARSILADEQGGLANAKETEEKINVLKNTDQKLLDLVNIAEQKEKLATPTNIIFEPQEIKAAIAEAEKQPEVTTDKKADITDQKPASAEDKAEKAEGAEAKVEGAEKKPETTEEKAENTEKAKEETKKEIDDKVKEVQDKLEGKHGKSLVEKTRTFLKVSLKDTYLRNNLVKIGVGAGLMITTVAIPGMGTILAPMLFSYGLKKFVEGGASLAHWQFAKERKDLYRAVEKEIVINELLSSNPEDKETLDKALKATVDMQHSRTNLQLQEVIARAQIKQKQIDNISKYLAMTASIANMVIGIVPMDLDMNGTTHMVQNWWFEEGEYTGRFFNDSNWKVYHELVAGQSENFQAFYKLGTGQRVMQGLELALAFGAVVGEDKINKLMGGRQSWIIPDSKITPKITGVRYEKYQEEIKEEAKPEQAKPEKQEGAEGAEKLSWENSEFDEINQFVINIRPVKANAETVNIHKLSLKEKIKERGEKFLIEFKNEPVPAEEKNRFEKYKKELVRSFGFLGMADQYEQFKQELIKDNVLLDMIFNKDAKIFEDYAKRDFVKKLTPEEAKIMKEKYIDNKDNEPEIINKEDLSSVPNIQENKVETKAEDIKKAFEDIGSGVRNGGIIKTREYIDRIKAVEAGQELKAGDKNFQQANINELLRFGKVYNEKVFDLILEIEEKDKNLTESNFKKSLSEESYAQYVNAINIIKKYYVEGKVMATNDQEKIELIDAANTIDNILLNQFKIDILK